MTRRILKPDASIPWPHQNIFPGEDITPPVDMIDPVAIYVDAINLPFGGMRYQPKLNVIPASARGYKVQWYWEGNEIILTEDKSIVLPASRLSVFPNGLQAVVTTSSGVRMTSSPNPVRIMDFNTAGLTKADDGSWPRLKFGDDYQIKMTLSVNLVKQPYPMPDLVLEYQSRDPARVKVTKSGMVTPLTDTAGNLPIRVKATYRGLSKQSDFNIPQYVNHPLTAIAFDKADLAESMVGSGTALNLKLTPADTGDTDAVWTNSNPDAVQMLVNATKLQAVLTMKAEDPVGATITASILSTNGTTYTATFKIGPIKPQPIPVQSVRFEPDTGSGLRVGDKFTLTPIFTPANATNKTGTFKAQDGSTLKVTTAADFKSATVEVLKSGSGTFVTFTSNEGGKTAIFQTGQLSPKPLPPAPIDLTTVDIDQRITYLGGEVPYIDFDGSLKWTGADVWPVQYYNGVAIGRTLPEKENVNRITKTHFEGANTTNQAGSDTWRYTSGAGPSFPGTAGIDGLRALTTKNWQNASRILQDDAVIYENGNRYNFEIRVGTNWKIYGGRFNLGSPAATETRFEISLFPNSVTQTTLYSYKESEPGDYTFSFFRAPGSGTLIYSLPQITKGKGARGPMKNATSELAAAVIMSNEDVDAIRLHRVIAETGVTSIVDIQTNGETQVTLQASDDDNWFEYLITKIEYIIN
ncbi:structural protein containing YjdB domain [Pantoea phage vB_PagM_LIET2]|uniref:Structural protein containing YjdB domain n=1 Tax=Pantoea phage vB_PagM_LIET2 TaxID=2508071 RepID=A0A411AW53_9CAUD|nr:structural protein containing YjdB domain [Pantoea phage vB_PagM_LIET2]QAX92337.1 structural protein containing YjdB domain [Pantoea phage vB_PagM_LIET2]